MARDLRLFYFFRLLSTSYLFVPVSVAYALSRGLSLVEVMLLNTVYCSVVILTEVPTGAIADRVGRRATMMAGALAMVAACSVYALAHGFAWFAVAEGLAALSMTLCSGADSAYLFDLLNDHGRGDEYPRREGTASAWHQAGQALAFAAGGLLGAGNLMLPYLVTAAVASVAFLVALSMGERYVPVLKDRPALSPREYVAHVRDAFGAVRRSGPLLWVIAYSAVVFVLLRATVYAYQPYLKESGFDIAQTGLIYAAVYLVAAAVAHNYDGLRRWLAEPMLVWMLLGTLVVTFVILGSIRGPWALVVMGVQAAANGLYSPLVKHLLQREIERSHQRATVLSVESMARRLAFGIFSPAVGGLMAASGAAAGLILCGVFGLAGMLALAATAPSRREPVKLESPEV
jgi:predicted MFS family arabinose efflux permease